MLVLKSLTFENIGRFIEPQTIDFTQLGPLVQIEGINNNTNGSSGAGKSTIFKALEFLLGLNDISNSVLQSRLTKETMSVVGVFDLDGQSLKIERSKKLLIELNGEVTTGSSKLTEEKLDQIIGMPRDLFRKILHKRQNEGGFFLDMGASETHKFLTSCLGLEKEQTKITILDDRLKELEKVHNLAFNGLESSKNALEATKEAILILGPPPTLDLAPGALETLKAAYKAAQDNHALVKESHSKELRDLELSRPEVKTIPFDRSDLERLEVEIGTLLAQITVLEDIERHRCIGIKTKISELQIEIGKLNNVEIVRQSEVKNQISNIRLEISKLQDTERQRQSDAKSASSAKNIEILTLKAQIADGEKANVEAISLAAEWNKVRSALCPTCDQSWVTESAKTKEVQLLEKIKDCKKRITLAAHAMNSLLSLEEEKKQLDLDAQPRPIPEIDSLMTQAKQLALDLQPKEVPGLEVLNAQIAQLKLDSQPQSIPEAVELKMKVDFKNKEILNIRQLEKDHQLKEDARIKDLLALYTSKQTEMRTKHENVINYLREEENKALRELENALNKRIYFEDALCRYDESRNKLEAQMLFYQNQLLGKSEELKLVQEEIELAQELKKAIKSYLSASFEDALDSIGDAATRFIRAIPNMANATVQFEGLKETKEGKIKEEVTCLLSMDGEIGVPIKSLSGGERSSTDLAIDLSVIKFIEERTGKGISLFVLDEPFTGLDSQNILEALEMLKECSIDKQLLIVDHNPLAAQSIENKLTVIRNGQISKVVQ